MLQKRYLDITTRAVRERRSPVLPKDVAVIRQALVWYKQRELAATRYRIEPLLLTPISFDVIATDVAGIDVPPEVFKAYERLFFNIRYEDGTLSKSCQLRTYFAFPSGHGVGAQTPLDQVWKACGAQLGYSGLINYWLWDGSGGTEILDIGFVHRDVWRLAQASLIERGLRGTMSDFDFNNLISKMVDSGRLAKETQNTGTVNNTDINTLMYGILNATAPVMKTTALSVDQNEAATKELAARFESQRQATGIGQREVLVKSSQARLTKLTDNLTKDK